MPRHSQHVPKMTNATPNTTQDIQYSPEVLQEVQQAIVDVFGGNMPLEELQKKIPAFQDILAKAISFAESNGIPLSADLIHQYQEEISATPSPLEDQGTNISPVVATATADQVGATNDMVKYVLFALVFLFVAIIVGKFAKVAAWIGMAIIAVLLVRHYQQKSALNKSTASALANAVDQTKLDDNLDILKAKLQSKAV